MNIIDKIRDFFSNLINKTQKVYKANKNSIKPISKSKSYNNWLKIYNNPNFYNTTINGYRLNSYSTYRKMIDEDGTIKSALKERKLKITGLNYEVIYKNIDEISDKDIQIKQKVEKWLKNINIEQKIYTMLESLEYGISVFEIIYDYVDGYYEVVDLQKRNPEHFNFLRENQHLVYCENIHNQNDYIDVSEKHPYQFVVHANNSDALNPFGESEIGLYGFVLYNMKKQFLIYYGVTGEKHGDPSKIASIDHYDNEGNSDPNLRDYLWDIAENALQNLDNVNSQAIIDKKVEIKHLQQEIKNSFDYKSAIEMIKKLQEIHIKGSTLTSDTSQYGNYSTSETHERTTNSIVRSDIKQLNNTITKMIKIWIDLNFSDGSIENYPEFRLIEPRNIDNQRLEMILSLIDRGLEIKKSAIANEFDIPISDDIEENDCFNTESNQNDNEILEKLKKLNKNNGKVEVYR